MGLTGDIYLTYITVDQTGNETENYQRNKIKNEKKILIPVILSTYTEMSRSEENKEKSEDEYEKETDKIKPKSTLCR